MQRGIRCALYTRSGTIDCGKKCVSGQTRLRSDLCKNCLTLSQRNRPEYTGSLHLPTLLLSLKDLFLSSNRLNPAFSYNLLAGVFLFSTESSSHGLPILAASLTEYSRIDLPVPSIRYSGATARLLIHKVSVFSRTIKIPTTRFFSFRKKRLPLKKMISHNRTYGTATSGANGRGLPKNK